jgi:hypothetical protein
MEPHATSKMPPKKKQKKATAVASPGDKTASPEDKKPEVKQERPPNYSQLEDELLCRAYVNISTDPTVGTDQSGETFWKRIKERFDVLAADKDKVMDRSSNSLKNRFQKTIQPEMNYFNKYLKQMKEEKPSGVPESHYPEHAAVNFQREKNRPFKHLHCVEILQKLPKFDPMFVPEVIDIDGDDSPVNKIGKPQGAGLERPVGCKKAKKQVKDDQYSQEMQERKLIALQKLSEAQTLMATSMASSTKQKELLGKFQMLVALGQKREAKAIMDIYDRERLLEDGPILGSQSSDESDGSSSVSPTAEI